jgi:tetratricopeptide (TPR) repeat protein
MDEIIRRRLGRVPPDQLPLLKLAAVCGRQVDRRVLDVAAGDTINVDGWLIVCANAAVLEAGHGAEWLFSHDKLRERILAELSPEETTTLHREVALILESVYGEATEKQPALAHHFKRAGMFEKAVHCYVRAAAESARLYAVADARAYHAEALELLSLLPDTVDRRRTRIDVTLKQVALSWYSVPATETLAQLAEVEELLASIDRSAWSPVDDANAARIHLFRGRAVFTTGRTAASLKEYRQGLDHLRASGDRSLELLLGASLGQSLVILGRYREAFPYLEQALATLAKAGNWPEWTRV